MLLRGRGHAPARHGSSRGFDCGILRARKRQAGGLLLLSHVCYDRRVTEVASRELRNRTRLLLDRVAAGERITITVDGRPVARLVPPESRPRWMARDIFIARVLGHQADAGLAADLAELAPDSTADLPL